MAEHVLQNKAIPLDEGWDVIVVGGGPAGCTAAAAAAREGAKTLLLEATGSLGGMGTAGLIPAWCPFSDMEKMIYRGLAEQVFTEAKKNLAHVDPAALDWVPINPERLKLVYDALVRDAGVQVLFHTMLGSVETDGAGAVTALIAANKKGLQAFRAKVYIDCTGDGDVAAWAGAEFVKGDPETGTLMPATHCFTLGNVKEQAYVNGPSLHANNKESAIYDIVQSGHYPLIPDTHMCNNLVAPGTVGFNAGHIWNVDNTDPYSVSAALMQGRQMAAAYRDALAEYQPEAYGDAFVASTGSLMGIRETRRILGDYVLTVQDYIARRSFDDEICRNSYYIDVHGTEKEEKGNVGERKEAETPLIVRYGKGESHGLPYRCLTPRSLTNVLIAGRSVSCERAVQGSVRVMPVCLAMGEAAGIAAAMAKDLPGGDVHAVDTAELRSRLRGHGAYLPEQQATR